MRGHRAGGGAGGVVVQRHFPCGDAGQPGRSGGLRSRLQPERGDPGACRRTVRPGTGSGRTRRRRADAYRRRAPGRAQAPSPGAGRAHRLRTVRRGKPGTGGARAGAVAGGTGHCGRIAAKSAGPPAAKPAVACPHRRRARRRLGRSGRQPAGGARGRRPPQRAGQTDRRAGARATRSAHRLRPDHQPCQLRNGAEGGRRRHPDAGGSIRADRLRHPPGARMRPDPAGFVRDRRYTLYAHPERIIE